MIARTVLPGTFVSALCRVFFKSPFHLMHSQYPFTTTIAISSHYGTFLPSVLPFSDYRYGHLGDQCTTSRPF